MFVNRLFVWLILLILFMFNNLTCSFCLQSYPTASGVSRHEKTCPSRIRIENERNVRPRNDNNNGIDDYYNNDIQNNDNEQDAHLSDPESDDNEVVLDVQNDQDDALNEDLFNAIGHTDFPSSYDQTIFNPFPEWYSSTSATLHRCTTSCYR